ncbi:MAG: RtcB family protein [Phocaeicola sp.]
MFEPSLISGLNENISENKVLFHGNRIALMEDAHIGQNVPVGFTMFIPKTGGGDYLVAPEIVSSDIGCGMTSNVYTERRFSVPMSKEVLEQLLTFINERVPMSGRGFSLGGGNHFLELGQSDDGTLLLTVHSGSRGYGGRVFKKHNSSTFWQAKRVKERKELIDNLKASGRHSEISSELAKLDAQPTTKRTAVPYHESGYSGDMWKAVKYASDNRKFILSIVDEFMTYYLDYLKVSQIETIHNYATEEHDGLVIRKGAVRARVGEPVIIPINMRDGIIVGNVCSSQEDRNWSLPHGAGRVHSRTSAKENLSLDAFKRSMGDVVTNDLTELLDEAPEAYKSLETIESAIAEHFSSYKVFKPLLNVKGE